jgi:hypothetical protein
VGKPEGRRPLERSRRIWEDNIKMGLRDVGWGARADRSDLGWTGGAVLIAVMNLRVP